MDLVIRMEDEDEMLQTNEDGSWKYTMYECAAFNAYVDFQIDEDEKNEKNRLKNRIKTKYMYKCKKLVYE